MTLFEEIEKKEEEIKRLRTLVAEENKIVLHKWLKDNKYVKQRRSQIYSKPIEGSIFKSEIRIEKNNVEYYYVSDDESRLELYTSFHDDIQDFFQYIETSEPPKKYKIVKTYIYEGYFPDYDCAESYSRDAKTIEYHDYEWSLEEFKDEFMV